MDPSTVAFIKGAVAFVLLAGTALSGFWLWSRARSRAPSDWGRELEALREEHAQLHADLSARVGELEERVDFAERRLVQERQGQLPPSRVPTPV